MFRLFDVLLALAGLILSFPVLLILFFVGLMDLGAPLFFQVRVGKNKAPFVLVKFRTMKVNTESVATHLADTSTITSYGRFMRRTKLDELPQLWNVLKGEMSVVGPRPCLFNQGELINERERRGIFCVKPGITGLAQIMKIDMSTPQLLAETEQRMIKNLTVVNYFRYILLTILGKGAGDRVRAS